jgi:hypothetical protein
VPGWTALTVVVLLTSGVQLVMLGVIGEYLWRNFDATRQRPLFIVDSMIGGPPSLETRPENATASLAAGSSSLVPQCSDHSEVR